MWLEATPGGIQEPGDAAPKRGKAMARVRKMVWSDKEGTGGWHVSRNGTQCPILGNTHHKNLTTKYYGLLSTERMEGREGKERKREGERAREGPAGSQDKLFFWTFPSRHQRPRSPIRDDPGRSGTSGYCCPPHPESTIPSHFDYLPIAPNINICRPPVVPITHSRKPRSSPPVQQLQPFCWSACVVPRAVFKVFCCLYE